MKDANFFNFDEDTYNQELLENLENDEKKNEDLLNKSQSFNASFYFKSSNKNKSFIRLSVLEKNNLYNILEVDEGATDSQIKKAYKKKISQSHPDKGGDPKTFQEIKDAYDILTCPLTRKIYDTFGSPSLELVKQILLDNKLDPDEGVLEAIDNEDLETLSIIFNFKGF